VQEGDPVEEKLADADLVHMVNDSRAGWKADIGVIPAQGLQQGGRGPIAATNVGSATGTGDTGVGTGGGPGRITGKAESAGPGLVGTPFPVPACCSRGEPAGATGAPAGTPAAIGAPAGTAPGGAPATTGGPGRTAGTGGAALATGAPSAAICSVHVGPPVGSGAAAAPGLNAKAAPHNPAPAVTVMPNSSTIFNAKLPCIRVQRGISTIKGATEPYRCHESFPRRATELVAEPIQSTSRTVTASFPNDDLRRHRPQCSGPNHLAAQSHTRSCV
jgi:hypothetical protein